MRKLTEQEQQDVLNYLNRKEPLQAVVYLRKKLGFTLDEAKAVLTDLEPFITTSKPKKAATDSKKQRKRTILFVVLLIIAAALFFAL